MNEEVNMSKVDSSIDALLRQPETNGATNTRAAGQGRRGPA